MELTLFNKYKEHRHLIQVLSNGRMYINHPAMQCIGISHGDYVGIYLDEERNMFIKRETTQNKDFFLVAKAGQYTGNINAITLLKHLGIDYIDESVSFELENVIKDDTTYFKLVEISRYRRNSKNDNSGHKDEYR